MKKVPSVVNITAYDGKTGYVDTEAVSIIDVGGREYGVVASNAYLLMPHNDEQSIVSAVEVLNEEERGRVFAALDTMVVKGEERIRTES